MATQVQFRRGTTGETSSFTGAFGEVTVDTTKNTCVVHNGSTAGGFPLMREDGTNMSLSLGTLSSCAVKFTADPDTGLISPGPNQISFVTGGVSRLAIDAAGAAAFSSNVTIGGSLAVTGAFTFGLGSAAAPPITFTGDTDTGIYSPGANQVAITTNGVGRLFVDGSGNVTLGSSSSLVFEGSTNDGFETTLAVVDPTADQVLTLPNITGTLITTGDTGTVTSTMIANGTIVDADINASAAIVDTKLATISTAGKVSNSATTATSSNTASAIVARDGSGNFSAGTITATFSGSGASLTSLPAGQLTGTIPSGVLGNSSLFVGTTSVALNRASGNLGLTGISSLEMPGASSGTITLTPTATAGTTAITIPATSGTLVTTGDTGTVTSTMIANNTIVDADINASAAIAGSKINPDFGSQTISTTGVFSAALGSAAAPSITFTGDTNTGIYSPGADLVAVSTGGTERVRIDSSGRLLVGTSTSTASAFTVQAREQLHGTSAEFSTKALFRWSNNAGQPTLNFNKSRGTSIGTRGVVLSGDQLGYLSFEGDDGTNFVRAAGIYAEVDGTPGAYDMPGRLLFSTTRDGYDIPTERLRIDNAGLHTINSNAHQGPALSATSPAKLLLATGTYTDTATAASGTVTLGPITTFDNPAIAATNTTVTYTTASTVYIDGAPTAGTNVTITNPLSLYIGSGQSSIPLGTATAPSLVFGTDTNTGIYSPGADQLALATGGTGRLFVDAAGDVGVNYSAPGDGGSKFQVEGSIGLGGSDETQVLSIGRVDSGAVNPLANISMFGAGAGNFRGAITFSTNSAGFFDSPCSERLRIDSSGRLLVGTSSARANFFNTSYSARIQVEGTDYSTAAAAIICNSASEASIINLARSRGTTTGSNTVVQSGDILGIAAFQGSDGAEFVSGAEIKAEVDGTPGANDMPGRLVFSTTADGASSPTERMRIDSSGRVGIGTTPSSKLHVSGAGGTSLKIEDTSSYAELALIGTGTVNYINSDDALSFYINGSDRARIDSSGRLLVGLSTARSNYSAYGASLAQIEGANNDGARALSVTYGKADGGDPIIALGKHRSNSVGGTTIVVDGDGLGQVVFSGSDGTNFVTAATIRAQVDGTPGANDMPGRLVFSTTADGASSPTERMRIDSSGRLLVGATSVYAVTSGFSGITQQVVGNDAASFLRYSADASAETLWFCKSRNATAGQHTILQNNDGIARFNFQGSDGTNFITAARISAEVDGTLGQTAGTFTIGQTYRILTTGTTDFTLIGAANSTPGTTFTATGAGTGTGTAINTAGDMPGRLVFSTSADNSGTPTERMRIDSSGRVGINTTNPGYTLDVAGTAKIGATTGDAQLEIGTGATVDRVAYVDFVGDTTYTDYGLRVVRNGGANANSAVQHRGTGDLRLTAQEAAPIVFLTTNTERARIDSSGRLLVGTSSSIATLSDNPKSQVFVGDQGAASFIRGSANEFGPNIHLAKSRNSSAGSRTVVQSGDELGTIWFVGDDGSTLNSIGAFIRAQVDGTPGLNDMPGRLVFSTTADGASSPTERMRISQDGTVGIGTTLSSSFNVNANQLVVGNGAGNNGITIYGGSTGASQIFFSDTVGTVQGYIAYQHSSDALIFQVNTSERARIDSTGRLLVGTSNTLSVAGGNRPFQVEGTGAGQSIVRHGSTTPNNAPALALGRSRSTANGGVTAVVQDDVLGYIHFAGANGSNLNNIAAEISCSVDGTVSGGGINDMPGRIVLSTTADGASSPTERLRIANDGRHTINSNAHQGTALSTTAPAKLYTSTGTYTDTATAASGTVTHGTIVAFDNPAIAATNTNVAYTRASTVYINGAPTAGTNVTIGTAYGLYVNAGTSYLGNQVLVGTATVPSTVNGSFSNFVVQGNTGFGTPYGALSIQSGTAPGLFSLNDLIGTLYFTASDGREYSAIQTKADEASSGTALGTRLEFLTTSTLTSTPTTKLTLNNGGTLTVAADSAVSPFISTIGGSEVARIDKTGRLLIGNSATRNVGSVAHPIQQETPSGTIAGLSIVRNSADIAEGRITFGKTRSTTVGGTTAVANGDYLGTLAFAGANGTDLNNVAATIAVQVDGAVSGGGVGDMPGRIVLSTTLDGASTPTEQWRITNDGVVCYDQPTPTSKGAAATLTVAELKTGIIQYTGLAATLTLPTGTLTEGGFSGIYTNMTFEWSVINTGSGTCTIGAGASHTITGSATIAAGASGRFATRRTAANTFVTYRLS